MNAHNFEAYLEYEAPDFENDGSPRRNPLQPRRLKVNRKGVLFQLRNVIAEGDSVLADLECERLPPV